MLHRSPEGTARIEILEFSLPSGLALNFHSYQMALVLAMSLGRTLVVEPSEADPSESDACTVETLPTLFKPLTSCDYSNASSGTQDDVTVSWDDAMTSSVVEKRVVRLASVVPTPSGFVDRGQAWVEPTWWAGFLDNLILAGKDLYKFLFPSFLNLSVCWGGILLEIT